MLKQRSASDLWQWAVDLWFPADRFSRRLVVMKPGGRVAHRVVHAAQMFVPVAFPCGEPVRVCGLSFSGNHSFQMATQYEYLR